MELKEKVAYLKGLAEGLKIEDASSEGKLLKEIIAVLDDFAEAIYDLDDAQDEIVEYVEEIDEDLSDLEEEFYEEDDFDEDDDFEFYEVECPNCHEIVVVDEDALVTESTVVCPSCDTEIEIEVDTECSCDCGCEHEEK